MAIISEVIGAGKTREHIQFTPPSRNLLSLSHNNTLPPSNNLQNAK